MNTRPDTLTVTQLNRFVKSLLEGDWRLRDINVTGEISNYRQNARSGHCYFTLRDGSGAIQCVMFSSFAALVGFVPKDGMKVVARGYVSIFEATGQYQLHVSKLTPQGQGDGAMALELLKKRLAAEGLFDPARKRPIAPPYGRIGIVTSPTGAALQDMLNVIRRRWPVCEVVFCGAQVQGPAAPRQLMDALRTLNLLEACDVIIMGRGGGSEEDLSAFNDEGLARAVAASRIPVVSAVGHDINRSVCDEAADYAAATPTAAAEHCTPDRRAIMAQLRKYNEYFLRKAQFTVGGYRQSLDRLLAGSTLKDRPAYVRRRREKVDGLTLRLDAAVRQLLEGHKGRLALAAGKLDALSPLKVLSRGYSVVYRDGKALRSLEGLPSGEEVLIQTEKDSRAAKLV